jgi:hypothetical protein
MDILQALLHRAGKDVNYMKNQPNVLVLKRKNRLQDRKLKIHKKGE